MALLLFLPLSSSISGMYIASLLGLQFGMPLWLLRLQSLKKYAQLVFVRLIGILIFADAHSFSELRGPWDAAVPKLSS